jgi:hypothetical protein
MFHFNIKGVLNKKLDRNKVWELFIIMDSKALKVLGKIINQQINVRYFSHSHGNTKDS